MPESTSEQPGLRRPGIRQPHAVIHGVNCKSISTRAATLHQRFSERSRHGIETHVWRRFVSEFDGDVEAFRATEPNRHVCAVAILKRSHEPAGVGQRVGQVVAIPRGSPLDEGSNVGLGMEDC